MVDERQKALSGEREAAERKLAEEFSMPLKFVQRMSSEADKNPDWIQNKWWLKLVDLSMENARLKELLEEASIRIFQHHEIGFIQRTAKQWGGPCELCCDGIFNRIEAAVRGEIACQK
jgi:hypothetical protein